MVGVADSSIQDSIKKITDGQEAMAKDFSEKLDGAITSVTEKIN